MSAEAPIKFYLFHEFNDSDYFRRELEKRFRETGHTRKIEFISWNCFNDEPDPEADLFCYDCGVLNALQKKNYLRELPDIIDLSDVFDWVKDQTVYRTKQYGVPMMGCCCAVICRRRDYEPFDNVYQIKGRIAAHIKSLIINFYLMSLCNNMGNRKAVMDVLQRIGDSMGSGLSSRASLSDSAVLDAFAEGSCQYFIGFTESIKYMPRDDYVVKLANFSENEENLFPFFMVDMVSMGSHVSGEKLLDCIDIMEIIAGADFAYGMCTRDGETQYLMPVNRRAFKRLAEQDDIYRQMYELMDNPSNCVMHFGPEYYSMIDSFETETLKKIGIDKRKTAKIIETEP